MRTQIQLTPEQARQLHKLAAERGVSMAELIRQGVEKVLHEDDRAEKVRRALAAVGKFRSGVTDLAVNHDKYLTDALSHGD